jgi:glycosyltransferase involved in cell wall biosynthesis
MGIPVVGSERTSYAHYRIHPFHRIFFRVGVRFFAQLTVNGVRIREGYPPSIAAKMKVVPNPVARAKALSDPVGGTLKTLLSVGGLRREKDHATLLCAFARIADRFPDWRLRIVGEGPMRPALEAQIAGLGLIGRAELAGASEMVEGEYRAAQLFVLPSLYEAFPNCLAEALAHGLPAVGFADCPGTNDLIIPGVNGSLASGVDRDVSLACALADLMGSASLRSDFGKAAPDVARNRDIEDVAELWEEVIRSVLPINREAKH